MPKQQKLKLALGLMSGTSLDGVDAALILTDGKRFEDTGHWLTLEYEKPFQELLYAATRDNSVNKTALLELERELTMKHVEAVEALLKKSGVKRKDVEVIGFHGQTIAHIPDRRLTWQLGDGSLLAEKTGIDVVSDFRRRDLAAGGQGAPLVPMFNLALIQGEARPVALLNIGGVANVAWHGRAEKDILAFDTGPGNALLNDWVYQHTGALYDVDGALSMKGNAVMEVVEAMLRHDFFDEKPPKSLDRHSFSITDFPKMSLESGAATLAEFTAQAVARSAKHFPKPAKAWYVTGGGRYNAYMMRRLGELLDAPVQRIEALGANGDALEAQAFAYFAVRSLKGLPLTLPATTGCKEPVTGGALYRA